MPLLNGEPFSRHRLDTGLRPDTTIYFCEATTEAFTNFDEYFERAVLCSSMAWSCAWTGKSELTFPEAVSSEADAHSSLGHISIALQKALLFLTQTIETKKFNDICYFLWSYTSCRFFVGEEVDVMHHNELKPARILKVIPPNHTTWESLPEVCFGMDASGFRYDVQSTDKSKKPFRMICSVERISRPNGNLSKDKVKLFLRQHVNTFKRLTITELKDSSIESLSLDQMDWPDVFAGPLPKLDPEDESLPTRIRFKGRSSSGSITGKVDRKKQADSAEKRGRPGPKPLDPEEKKRKMEEQRKRQNEKKRLERERLREERIKHAKLHAEWSRKRDDLECDDLKPLLTGIPVQCQIPNHFFGDALLILEFYHNFSEFFDSKEIFPHGFTFDLLQRVLCEKSIKSPISDLIRITLATIFCMQEEEDSEETKEDKKENDALVEENLVDDDDVAGDDMRSAMNQALKVLNVLKRIHGPKMSNIELNPLTVSEVLRLHLLTSGAPRPRNIYRGWFCAREDACLQFRIERPDIVEKLSTVSVYELESEEKIAIFVALINQVMNFPAFREIVEVTIDKIVEIRKEMRSAQADFSRWERENAVKKRKEGEATEAGDDPTVANEMTSAELEAAIATYNSEREKRSAALEKVQSQKRQRIREFEAQYGLKPIGRDRAYRRYWTFNSVAGIFIEQDDAFTGSCVQIQTSENYNPTAASLSPTNNKENEFGSNRKLPSGIPFSPSLSSLHTCSNNPSTCTIHSSRPTPRYKWRFIANPEDVQDLIDALNLRGFRESDLATSLKSDLKFYEEHVSECPISKLNSDIPAEPRRENTRLVYYRASMSGMSHIDKDPETALKMMFVDHILSFEDQLFLAGLSFRLNSAISRDEWKTVAVAVEASDVKFVSNMSSALQKLGSIVPVNNLRNEWPITKWNECLDDATSVSRLFFLLSVLESKVEFPKNVSGYCRICRRKKDAEHMLLCDSCNAGHHTYCLKPPLDEVPKGEWFCPNCKQVPKVPKSPRKPVNREAEEEMDDDVDEIYTIESRTPSPGSTESNEGNESEEENDDTECGDNTENEEDVCAICGSTDDDPDAECTSCGCKFHVSCHVPKITGNLRNWICHKCSDQKGVSGKRKDTAKGVEHANESTRPKRTRFAFNNTVSEQTDLSGRKVRTSNRSTRHSDDDGYNYMLCYKLLDKLKLHTCSWPFLKRPISKHAPNYNEKVKTHIDLGILTQNLNTGVYTSNSDLIRDACLMFSNCKSYWDRGTQQHEAGVELYEFFRTIVKEHMPHESSVLKHR